MVGNIRGRGLGPLDLQDQAQAIFAVVLKARAVVPD